MKKQRTSKHYQAETVLGVAITVILWVSTNILCIIAFLAITSREIFTASTPSLNSSHSVITSKARARRVGNEVCGLLRLM